MLNKVSLGRSWNKWCIGLLLLWEEQNLLAEIPRLRWENKYIIWTSRNEIINKNREKEDGGCETLDWLHITELMIMHKTLILCMCLLSDENKIILFFNLHPLPGLVIFFILPFGELRAGNSVCWSSGSLVRVYKEQGAQVHLSSILFENFVNGAKLY